MYRTLSAHTFEVNENISIRCTSERTRYGFRHLASIVTPTQPDAHAKACYYNRTWEAFEFESVARAAASKLHDPERQIILDYLEHYKEPSAFGPLAGLMALADILTDKPEDANRLKARALAVVPGIELPDDWDSLPEEEKARRLAGVQQLAAEQE